MRKEWVAWPCHWGPLTACLPSGHCSCCLGLVQDKVLLKWGKLVIPGVVYLATVTPYNFQICVNVILVFSMLITLVMCMEVVSRGCSLTYTSIFWYSFCLHCLSASPALTVWKMQDITCCLILFFPYSWQSFLPPSLQSLNLTYFTPPCLRAALKLVWNAHTCTDSCAHVYISIYKHYFHMAWEDNMVYIISHLLPWPFQITYVKFLCYFSLS